MNENLYNEIEKQINNIINELKINIVFNDKINFVSLCYVFLRSNNVDHLPISDILNKPINELRKIVRNDYVSTLKNNTYISNITYIPLDEIIVNDRINLIKLFRNTVDNSIDTTSLIKIMLELSKEEVNSTIEFLFKKNDMELKLKKVSIDNKNIKDIMIEIFESMRPILLHYIIKRLIKEIDILIKIN